MRICQCVCLCVCDLWCRPTAAASIAAAARVAGGELMRKRLMRITHEVCTLSTSLPLSWESSVLLAVDKERMDVLRYAGLGGIDRVGWGDVQGVKALWQEARVA